MNRVVWFASGAAAVGALAAVRVARVSDIVKGWNRAAQSGDLNLAAVCLVYFGVVYLTARIFLTAPRYRALMGDIQALDAVTAVRLSANGDSRSPDARETGLTHVNELLEQARSLVSRQARNERKMHRHISLAKVGEARRLVAAARWVLWWSLNDAAIEGGTIPLAMRLKPRSDQDVAAELQSIDEPAVRRERFLEYVDMAEQSDVERDLRHGREQRRGLWLALIALFAAFVVGVSTNRINTLLFGGLGGFLAPLASVVLRRPRDGEYRYSWAVLVLSPAAGAVTAVAGLLLVQMLSHPKIEVLGEVFREHSWHDWRTGIASALALLFGFSGKLFSDLAVKATATVGGAGASDESVRPTA